MHVPPMTEIVGRACVVVVVCNPIFNRVSTYKGVRGVVVYSTVCQHTKVYEANRTESTMLLIILCAPGRWRVLGVLHGKQCWDGRLRRVGLDGEWEY